MKALKFLLLLFIFTSCREEKVIPNQVEEQTWKTGQFTKFKIKQGTHFSFPVKNKFFWKSCYQTGQAYFTEQSRYNLKDVDQLDLNKLCGYKFDFNNPPHKAAMVTWRYDTLNNNYIVAPYFNDNNKPNGYVLPENDELLIVQENEIFNWQYELHNDTGKIIIWNDSIIIEKSYYLGKRNLFYSVGPWFGGNESAPVDIELYLKYN